MNIPEYRAIAAHYGDERAKRSRVRLMQHIDEGISILQSFPNPERTIPAFCLHPLVQNNVEINLQWSPALGLAQEYARCANAYLCTPETDALTMRHDAAAIAAVLGAMSRDCAYMLLADKFQNQRDFQIYHTDHPRARELTLYFEIWIRTLVLHYVG